MLRQSRALRMLLPSVTALSILLALIFFILLLRGFFVADEFRVSLYRPDPDHFGSCHAYRLALSSGRGGTLMGFGAAWNQNTPESYPVALKHWSPKSLEYPHTTGVPALLVSESSMVWKL